MATPQETNKALREVSEMVQHHLELADRIDRIESTLSDIAKGLVMMNQNIGNLKDNMKVQIGAAVGETIEVLKYEIRNLAPITSPMPLFPGNGGSSQVFGQDFTKFRGINLTAENAKELLQNARSKDEVESILKAIRPN